MNTSSPTDRYFNLIRRFPLRRITSDEAFEEASAILEEFMRKGDDNLTRDEIDYIYILGKLVADFEEGHRKIVWDRLKPGELLQLLMEENGLSLADLAPIVQHKSNLSAFLHGHRGLSHENAAKLGAFFKVDPILFLKRPGLIA